MVSLSVPRLLIAGTHSGVGKSLVTMALALALRKQGVSYSLCVTGSKLQQAILFRRINRRYVRTLDPSLLSVEQLSSSMFEASRGAEVLLIDGSMGLFDGPRMKGIDGLDASLAALTATPVVLVMETGKLERSLAPIVHGFNSYKKEIQLAGIIGTRVVDASNPHRNKFFQDSLSLHGLPPLFGEFPVIAGKPKLPRVDLTERENDTALPMQLFIDLANAISEHVNVDLLLEQAALAPAKEMLVPEFPSFSRRGRIAVAEDNCFSTCFQDNVDLLRLNGADILPFSPLADQRIPADVGGLYLTGAFVRTYGQELSQNEQMKQSILDFAEAGGVIYAEAGGAAYLCKEFQLEPNGEMCAGVGLMSAVAIATEGQPEYLTAETIESSVLGEAGLLVRGVSNGEWAFKNVESRAGSVMVPVLEVGHAGESTAIEGYSPSAQSVITPHFLHFGSNPEMARNLVDAAQVVQT